MLSVERAMTKAAASLLPGLLPTPPAKPCLIILPASFASNPNPKPGRADSVERWDAHKNYKKPKSPALSCCSSSPGRASSCERWDINKQISVSSCTSSSSSSSRRSSTSPGGASSCGRRDGNKWLPPSHASSVDRWDTHKKPRPAQAAAESWTGNKEDQEVDTTPMV